MNDQSTVSHNDIMDVEDIFQNAGVFYNGIRGEDAHCHMASYMTCINYNLLEKVWLTVVDQYLKGEWLELAEYWERQAYLSPVFSQLSSFVNRKIGVS